MILDCGDNLTPGPASSPPGTRCRSRHVTEATVICAVQGKFIPSCVDGTGAAFWNQWISFTLEEAREVRKKKTGAHVRFLEILRRRNAFCPSSRQQQQQNP